MAGIVNRNIKITYNYLATTHHSSTWRGVGVII